MFANKTFANKTFANGETLPNVLAKVQWTFANWRSYTECIGESIVDFRQLARFQRPYWRKYSGLSPIGECQMGYLSGYTTILIKGICQH